MLARALRTAHCALLLDGFASGVSIILFFFFFKDTTYQCVTLITPLKTYMYMNKHPASSSHA